MTTTTMATYRRTLCWMKKEHDPEHRKGVCCRGKLINHGRYRRGGTRRYSPGCRQGVLRAIRCTAVVVHLDREGLTARFLHGSGSIGNNRSVSSRGRGCEGFREEFCCTRGRCGLYRFQSSGETSSSSLLKLLRVSVSGIHRDGLSL